MKYNEQQVLLFSLLSNDESFLNNNKCQTRVRRGKRFTLSESKNLELRNPLGEFESKI
jgi:hypothetical protein